MIIYIVTVNGKVSQEAYSTLNGAYNFIRTRTEGEATHSAGSKTISEGIMTGYSSIECNGNIYTIHDVRVA